MSKLIEDRIGNWLAPDQWRVASTTSMAEAYSLLREAEQELRRLREQLRLANIDAVNATTRTDQTQYYNGCTSDRVDDALERLDFLLSTPQPQAKEEVVCTCGAAFDVGRYCTCQADPGKGRE